MFPMLPTVAARCPRTVLSNDSVRSYPRAQNTTQFTPSATALVTVQMPASIVPRNYKATTFSYYRERNGDTQFTSLAPAAKYQRLKLTRGTVRVSSSQYTENRAALTVNPVPGAGQGLGVCWNQMSDRQVAHVQPRLTASGSNPGGSSTRRSLVRLRPGALVPGGTGVDIKHNSYERRLLRLKARAGLLTKPGLDGPPPPPAVAGCQCVPPPVLSDAPNTSDLMSVPYHWVVGQWVQAPVGTEPDVKGVADVTVPLSSLTPSRPYHSHPFYVGQVVLALQVPGDDVLSVCLVTKITADGLYLVLFLDGTSNTYTASELTAANPYAYPAYLFVNVNATVASVHQAQLLALQQNNGIVSLSSAAVSDVNTLQWQNVIDQYRNRINEEGP